MNTEVILVILKETQSLCKKAGLAESTIRKKLRTLNRILKGINKFSVQEIENWLDSYRYGRENKPLGPHGRNNYISAIKWYLCRSKMVKIDQGILASLKKEPFKPKDRSFDEEALEHVLQFSPSTLHELAFRLIRECGFRPHELLSITVSDISETREGWALIELPDTNPETSSGRNKTGSRSIICVRNAQRLLNLVKKYRETRNDKKRIFPWS
ncbi:MAG: hypothetical protein GF329_21790 [Candidatus Lokiarchaeota archaeon]|nr:hypothetical protein [Candidatus Lokiarchaeota archaeon]